jgi:hypothetical protein
MNRFGSFFKPLMWFMALLLAAFVAGCGGDDEVAAGPTPPPAPIGLVGGNWTITETATTASDPLCTPDGNNELNTYGLVVVQSGNSLTLTKGTDPDFTGTISGDQASWTGSYAEESGTTTITSLSATVGATCNTASGTSNWSYSEPGFSCTGSTTFDAAEDAPQTDCAS